MQPMLPHASFTVCAALLCLVVSSRQMHVIVVFSALSLKMTEDSGARVCAERQGKPLVIGAGFKKTGTSTLGQVMVDLGWTKLCSGDTHIVQGPCNTVGSLAHVDAVEDDPWCCNHALLAAAVDHYPCARVVLSTRNESAWYDSALRWIAHHVSEGNLYYPTLFTQGLGIANMQSLSRGNLRAAFIKAYRSHIVFVRSLFTGNRSSRLLEVDWTDKDSMPRLCMFLGLNESNPLCHSDKVPHCRNFTEANCKTLTAVHTHK